MKERWSPALKTRVAHSIQAAEGQMILALGVALDKSEGHAEDSLITVWYYLPVVTYHLRCVMVSLARKDAPPA